MSTTIGSNGNASLNSKSGRLNFEHDKNRLVGRDDENRLNIILLDEPGEQPLFEMAQYGFDVTTCTDDQKIMSSKFNMFKIIASGDLTTTYRAGTVSLDATTNIGYRIDTFIDTGIGSSYSLDGHLLINVQTGLGIPFAGSGYLYDNGTNTVLYKRSYSIDPVTGFLKLSQAFRCVKGSFTFNPSLELYTYIKWDVCNQTIITKPGGGATGTLDTKYFYYDTVTYDADGNNTVALASSTVKFFTTEWPRFPDYLWIRYTPA